MSLTECVELTIEIDREEDGRWIAEALEIPGVMACGDSLEEAVGSAEKLAIEVIADRIKHGELPKAALSVSFRVSIEQVPATKANRILAVLLRIGWRVKRRKGFPSHDRAIPGQTANLPFTTPTRSVPKNAGSRCKANGPKPEDL
jgi:predicted RNase H-like HicB family nuclease